MLCKLHSCEDLDLLWHAKDIKSYFFFCLFVCAANETRRAIRTRIIGASLQHITFLLLVFPPNLNFWFVGSVVWVAMSVADTVETMTPTPAPASNPALASASAPIKASASSSSPAPSMAGWRPVGVVGLQPKTRHALELLILQSMRDKDALNKFECTVRVKQLYQRFLASLSDVPRVVALGRVLFWLTGGHVNAAADPPLWVCADCKTVLVSYKHVCVIEVTNT